MALSDELEALAKRHGALSYRNRADTQNPAFGFSEAGLASLLAEVRKQDDALIRQMRYALALPCDRWNATLSRASCAKQSTPQTRGWRQEMNMSYCRFQNTVTDLADCLRALEEIDLTITKLVSR